MLQLQPDIAASRGVTKGRRVGVRFIHAFFQAAPTGVPFGPLRHA